MRSLAGALGIAFLTATFLHAGVATSVACAAYGYAPMSDSSICGQGGPGYGLNPSASAFVASSVTLPSSPSSYLVTGIYELTYAAGGFTSNSYNPTFGGSSASASAALHLELSSG